MAVPFSRPGQSPAVTIMAPRVGAHRCGNCKHQLSLGRPVPCCVAHPPSMHVVPDTYAMFGPGSTVEVEPGKALRVDGPGALRIIHSHLEAHYPPAPSEATCGEWTARLLDNTGNRLE